MSTNESWMHLTACPCLYRTRFTRRLIVPDGIDIGNYIAIGDCTQIYCIYKYNTDTDKWNKIDGCNVIQRNEYVSAAVDVKKHLLFLSDRDSVTQIQLNNGNRSDYTTNNIE
eukprot:548461_1